MLTNRAMPNAKPKAKLGRPKLAATKSRVNVCFDRDILERATAASLASNMSLSGFIAEVMRKHLKRAKV